MNDPWKHRALNMRCATCMWFVEKAPEKPGEGAAKLGRCRKYAPSAKGFVPVFANDWCGDHRLDENKI